MSYTLTNKSGGQIVCDLSVKGKTLRLDNGKSMTIKDNEITPHIKHLIKVGLMMSEEILETKTKKNTVSKNSNKEKEE